MPDIDDLFSEPNAGAYEVEESRSGPPLSYVGEKLRHALGQSHRAATSARRVLAESGARSAGARMDREIAELEKCAEATFRYLTAFLGLYNMLGLLSNHRKPDALLKLDSDGFEDWLNRIEREGSVTG